MADPKGRKDEVDLSLLLEDDDEFHLADHRRPEVHDRPDLHDDDQKAQTLGVETFAHVPVHGIVAGVIACG
ncbi:TPA: hypothetical protein DCZ46_03135 [Candidatus Campbellbacteria bacterium]|nr:MAG: seg [Candidatus Campbellbacteria bacterium GW2011_OD1_34_28]KKP74876.1 MAG: hypothetical protein UR74_C0002G0142 [Candidatus Campbellbacteria bacterium GW2011_GWD2_35_24]KKP75762.1 MAG: hypothetical protein UR75_C0002G0143 [Candidatus Campbellbacteria bacterium GW2011_GWC2_35_28]KKP76990.1 MAG: hypothetical protein UR76_C0002G0191 [Candidatus Campbellbacteria bacterium GW2011_GWC1_35_31]KKP78916.1 MAG: hypothetical protein UR79_C0002G0191 [Candidatus Campbellbacteria bacterium GW2011_GW